jgi:hypothetical protein
MTGWQAIATAPRDETHILLFSTLHGQIEAWFSPGSWHETVESREYDGPVWVFGDDAFQIEIEETPDGYCDGSATHWRPLHEPPEPTP